MRFFRFICSRLFLTLLSLLIQIGLLVFIFIYARIWFWLFDIISYGLALAIFLKMVYRKERAEYKVSWSVVLFLLPIFGVVCYFLFANPKLRKKQFNIMNQEYNKCSNYFPNQQMNAFDNKKQFDKYYGVSNYLYTGNFMTGSYNNRTTFYPLGEKYWSAIIEELKKAQTYIFIQFFIIRPGKLWNEVYSILKEKVKQGVEVRIMYDDLGSFGNPYGFCKDMNKNGISAYRFNRLGFFATGRYNNRDHRKIVVVDGRVGFTGGVNLSDEYVNITHKLGHWKDSGIKIEGEAVKNLTANFLMLFNTNRNVIDDNYDKYLNYSSIKYNDEGYVQPFVAGPNQFYLDQVAENNFLNMIGIAQKSIDIYTPYLITDYDLLNAIKNAALKGVKVRIVTPHIPDKKVVFYITRSNYEFLISSGVKIYEYGPGFIHAKEMIVDEDMAFIGTINLDYRSLVHHFECGANLYKTDSIKDMIKDFNETVSKSIEMSQEKIHTSIFIKLISLIANLFQPML